jgi:TolA-binding protein
LLAALMSSPSSPLRLGNRRQAKALLDKVVRAYPKSRAAREAAAMRERLFRGDR